MRVPTSAPVFLLLLATCGGTVSKPQIPALIEGVIASQVSSDQSLLAYYSAPSHLMNGPITGSLSVVPLPSGVPISLGDGAFDANFDRGPSVLYFFTNPAIDVESPLTEPPTYDGALSIWTPAMS